MTTTARRRAARLWAGPLLALSLVGCGTTSADDVAATTGTSPAEAESQPQEPQESQQQDLPALYDVSSRTVGGADWSGAEMAGRPAVLWFWAPWCPTCRAQVSGVNALAQTHGDDVALVGVGAQDDADAIAGFAADVDPGVTSLSDVDGSVWRHFGVTAQSTYVVLDADGEVRGEGYLDEAELGELVDELVAEQAG
ncbi:thiol:disulfide interchange protein [Nocardioides sp. OK12]|uniref:Thiol-disulfide isomerase/thioredoxin n=1 Tax=Nocardioides marinisabuli TaxID=419476 RepID=A0A7Y9EXR1_9ACTN|nr:MULTISPECIES: redoxin family protein [Nocardioides]NYD55804.1 thiol-disulfide isomerase/thioredoxin [Nocardioides marinisabuli]GHJ59821.1 thiol:disulfide interchange protein [Nocardioides sp. OK12]